MRYSRKEKSRREVVGVCVSNVLNPPLRRARHLIDDCQWSSRAMARTGLRMMPTSPSPPLKFRTAGFPQYGFKASMSDRAFLQARNLKPAPGIRSLPRSLLLPFARFRHRRSPGSVSKTIEASTCRCAGGSLPTPGVLGSGSSCAVSIHPRLLLPHAPVSQARCDFTSLRLYAAPSLCGSA